MSVASLEGKLEARQRWFWSWKYRVSFLLNLVLFGWIYGWHVAVLAMELQEQNLSDRGWVTVVSLSIQLLLSIALGRFQYERDKSLWQGLRHGNWLAFGLSALMFIVMVR